MRIRGSGLGVRTSLQDVGEVHDGRRMFAVGMRKMVGSMIWCWLRRALKKVEVMSVLRCGPRGKGKLCALSPEWLCCGKPAGQGAVRHELATRPSQPAGSFLRQSSCRYFARRVPKPRAITSSNNMHRCFASLHIQNEICEETYASLPTSQLKKWQLV